jgi:hypothetical protein
MRTWAAAIGGLAVLVLAVIVLVACGVDRIDVGGTGGPARQAPARPITPASDRAAVTPDTAILATLARDDGLPVTGAVSLRDGTIFVEPSPSGLVPRIGVDVAHAAALAEPGASDPASLTCRAGILTDTDLTDAGGTLLYDQTPVWMCFWVNAIVGPSATPREHENILTFVDATTGDTLFTTADVL